MIGLVALVFTLGVATPPVTFTAYADDGKGKNEKGDETKSDGKSKGSKDKKDNGGEKCAGGKITGAIFTTDSSGTLVNGNIYQLTTDVYLNGGPAAARRSDNVMIAGSSLDDGEGGGGGKMPAGLPDGNYYFQVTNPSGQILLSTGSVQDRQFQVVNGYIQSVIGPHQAILLTSPYPPNYTIVQMAKFLPTDNSGKEYKVWVTPVGSYQPNNGVFGFLPACSKTDNFKALSNSGGGGGPVPYTVTLSGSAFLDPNLNGVWEPAGTPAEPGFAGVQVRVFQAGNPTPVAFTSSGTLGGWSIVFSGSGLPATYTVKPTLIESGVSLSPTSPQDISVTITADGQAFQNLDFGVVIIGDSGSLIRLSPAYFAGAPGQAVLAATYPNYDPQNPPSVFASPIVHQPLCPASAPFASLASVGSFFTANAASADPMCRIAANWLSLSIGTVAAGGINGTEIVYVGNSLTTGAPIYSSVNALLASVASNYLTFTPAELEFYATALQRAADNFTFILFNAGGGNGDT
jgi:hypothetical protein